MNWYRVGLSIIAPRCASKKFLSAFGMKSSLQMSFRTLNVQHTKCRGFHFFLVVKYPVRALCPSTAATARPRSTATLAAGGSPSSHAGQTGSCTTTGARCTGRTAGGARIYENLNETINYVGNRIFSKHVYDVPVPFCLNKLYRTDCPLDCSKAGEDKVSNREFKL